MAISTDGFGDRLTLLLETQTRVRALREMWKTVTDRDADEMVARVAAGLDQLDRLVSTDIERRYAAVEDYYCG